MVQALLDGRKTQTRRVVKGVDNHYYQSLVNHATGKHTFVMNGIYDPQESDVCEIKCPYGQPGDVLWVRETWAPIMDINDRKPLPDTYCFAVDLDGSPVAWNWKPNIHMPKKACRLFLKVKSVRVERLKDINEEDAMAEGIQEFTKDGVLSKYGFDNWEWQLMPKKPSDAFSMLWAIVNSQQSWDANPWVWVVEFERTERPEDFLTRQPKQKKCISLG